MLYPNRIPLLVLSAFLMFFGHGRTAAMNGHNYNEGQDGSPTRTGLDHDDKWAALLLNESARTEVGTDIDRLERTGKSRAFSFDKTFSASMQRIAFTVASMASFRRLTLSLSATGGASAVHQTGLDKKDMRRTNKNVALAVCARHPIGKFFDKRVFLYGELKTTHNMGGIRQHIGGRVSWNGVDFSCARTTPHWIRYNNDSLGDVDITATHYDTGVQFPLPRISDIMVGGKIRTTGNMGIQPKMATLFFQVHNSSHTAKLEAGCRYDFDKNTTSPFMNIQLGESLNLGCTPVTSKA